MGNNLDRTTFLVAALWHGLLERANQILAEHPELASSDIHTAAVLGDDGAVRRFLAADPNCVNAKSPPYDGDALNYLGLSKFLRLDSARGSAFVSAATALLDAGANPNTGFWNKGEFETALYGAAGVAHDVGLTRLLIERGADPNDPEVTYHFDHGADFASRHPELPVTSMGLVARRGRSDILELAKRRGVPLELSGLEALLACCALSDVDAIGHISRSNPQIVRDLVADGGQILAEFAGNDNASGVRHLLALGVPVDARFRKGDGYWDVAPDSTALHVAAWRAAHDTARLLIERSADVNARDGEGRTPLLMAVKACVDSYWTEWRKPDTVAALLAAGAITDGVPDVTGYDEVDALLAAHRTRRQGR